ncbi:ChaB-1 [Artaxa digramma nucleopolyhedrovirus]|uniref:ChaB-1 n=1 Tax=Artaxa digramma nucleopolyhedrovirus TaxID=3070910 RepID=A0AAE6R6I6_9ABAC|nr:ChaB-1 [Euproctis digramma nucleopolyhedrovirus]QHB21695.1 ChaB-1 [Artaxa digramma nucleopolyhedrovirus]
MNYLAEAHFREEIPARAKRLYCKTFNRYHKLNGGDEDVALHLARRAVEKNYVKLNDRWYPKAAAELIVRHDIDDDETSDDNVPNYLNEAARNKKICVSDDNENVVNSPPPKIVKTTKKQQFLPSKRRNELLKLKFRVKKNKFNDIDYSDIDNDDDHYYDEENENSDDMTSTNSEEEDEERNDYNRKQQQYITK